jgi:hypothetical protein
VAQPRSWREMYERIAEQIKRETGSDVRAWNARIKERGPHNAADLKAWLNEHGIDGYPAMLLGFETFGYPDYLEASADELIDGQYRDRPAIRPIYDRLIEHLPDVGEVEVQARKTYVALIGPKPRSPRSSRRRRGSTSGSGSMTRPWPAASRRRSRSASPR